MLAFVPEGDTEMFRARMDELLGYEACMPVTIGAPGVRARRLIR